MYDVLVSARFRLLRRCRYTLTRCRPIGNSPLRGKYAAFVQPALQPSAVLRQGVGVAEPKAKRNQPIND